MPNSLPIAAEGGFDRRFVERPCGAFAILPWACAWAETPGADEGFDSAKLGP